MTVKITNKIDRFAKLIHHKAELGKHFLKIGEQLYHLKDEYADHGFVSFNALLADPDVDISRTTAYKLKGIYEDFVLKLNVEPVLLRDCSTEKLEIIRPHVTEENKDSLIAQAQTLSRSDLYRWKQQNFQPEKPHPKDDLIEGLKTINGILYEIAPLGKNNYQRQQMGKMKVYVDAVLEDYNKNEIR